MTEWPSLACTKSLTLLGEAFASLFPPMKWEATGCFACQALAVPFSVLAPFIPLTAAMLTDLQRNDHAQEGIEVSRIEAVFVGGRECNDLSANKGLEKRQYQILLQKVCVRTMLLPTPLLDATLARRSEGVAEDFVGRRVQGKRDEKQKKT